MGGGRAMKADRELIKAVKQMKTGEEKGFNVLYTRTYNFVYARARQSINDEQEALDLVQEVYIAAYRNIQSLQDINSLYGWLGSITIRQGAKMANKKKNQVLLSEEYQGMLEEIPDETAGMEDIVINEENAGILKGLLGKLPEEQRSVVVSFYYDGLKVEQIAELTETSAGTIKSRLYLARKRLKEFIRELEEKEGCTLRGLNTPLILLAVKLLLEETTLSKAVAQNIYNRVCTKIGAQGSSLLFGETETGRSISMEEKMGEPMKGQGMSMNNIISKLAGLGKVKLATIAVGTVAVLGAGTATGVYVHHQAQVKEAEAQAVEQKEKEDTIQKEQEKLLTDLSKRYKGAKKLYQNLILKTGERDILKKDFKAIQTALDEKSADKKTEKQMAELENNLEGYKKENQQYLTQKEAGLYNYHSELFPQEHQESLDTMRSEYKSLFETVKYKDADKKLDEMITIITAFLDENQEDNTEVASNDTEEPKNSETGKKDNTDSSTGNGGNSQNETPAEAPAETPAEVPAETPTEPPAEPEEPKQTGDFANGWTYAEADILNTINNNWSDFVYDDAGAQAQLAAQLPGRSCTLVHYPAEQNAEARALWDSLDSNVYAISNFLSDDVYGSWFIYGK